MGGCVETSSRCYMPENKERSALRRGLRRSFAFLPRFGKRMLNSALSSYYLTEQELARVLSDSPFSEYEVSRYEHPSGWAGIHLDCLLTKEEEELRGLAGKDLA